MRAGSHFGRATIYEARPFTPGGFMSPSSNGEAWIERPGFFLEFLGGSDLFSLLRLYKTSERFNFLFIGISYTPEDSRELHRTPEIYEYLRPLSLHSRFS